jgi:cation diffusion facilitator family transporter
MNQLKKEAMIIKKTTIWTMILNLFLMIMKITAGIIGRSTAIISDALNSAGDVGTAFVVMLAGKYSRKERDEEHPYGHEKFESMVSVFLGLALIVSAFEIGKAAVMNIYGFAFEGLSLEKPTIVALIAAIMTIFIKELMYHFTKRNAKVANSPSLSAMAWDHRSDQFSALGVVVGVGGAMLGIAVLEPIASVLICFMILFLGIRIIKVGISQVVDQATDPLTLEDIRKLVLDEPGVESLDDLKTRIFGAKLFVDLEIGIRSDLSVQEAHDIAQKLHDTIEEKIPNVKHCMVHVNPSIQEK